MEVGTPNNLTYFETIENLFVELREKHLLLSPLDWALIEEWKQRGIPLKVAVRGIHSAFDSHNKKEVSGAINSLRYCEGAVEAQFRIWLASQVGVTEFQDVQSKSECGPFSEVAVLGHLRALQQQLHDAKRQINSNILAETIAEAIVSLQSIEGNTKFTQSHEIPALESALMQIQNTIDKTLREIEDEKVPEYRKDAESQLMNYRSGMQSEVYRRTITMLILRHLRRSYGIPEFSLFRL